MLSASVALSFGVSCIFILRQFDRNCCTFYANGIYSDQIRSVASDLGLYCLSSIFELIL